MQDIYKKMHRMNFFFSLQWNQPSKRNTAYASSCKRQTIAFRFLRAAEKPM
jgi:hypothetical protein